MKAWWSLASDTALMVKSYCRCSIHVLHRSIYSFFSCSTYRDLAVYCTAEWNRRERERENSGHKVVPTFVLKYNCLPKTKTHCIPSWGTHLKMHRIRWIAFNSHCRHNRAPFLARKFRWNGSFSFEFETHRNTHWSTLMYPSEQFSLCSRFGIRHQSDFRSTGCHMVQVFRWTGHLDYT